MSRLEGERFGRLIVVEVAERRNDKIFWICKCDCGKKVIVSQVDLKQHEVYSCGSPACIYKAMKANYEFAQRQAVSQ